MLKMTLIALATAYAAAALTAPAMAAGKPKAAPGMCGTMMFFDKKTKKCKSAVR